MGFWSWDLGFDFGGRWMSFDLCGGWVSILELGFDFASDASTPNPDAEGGELILEFGADETSLNVGIGN